MTDSNIRELTSKELDKVAGGNSYGYGNTCFNQDTGYTNGELGTWTGVEGPGGETAPEQDQAPEDTKAEQDKEEETSL